MNEDPKNDAALSDWNVMAYMAGDNNLEEEMVGAIQQIQSQSQNGPNAPWVRVFCQFDPSALGIPTQRYAFIDLEDTTPCRADCYHPEDFLVEPPDEQMFDETNTGNPGALSGFAGWAANSDKVLVEHPEFRVSTGKAEHTALILSGHGSGATEDFLMIDESAEDSLTIVELEKALADARVLMKAEKEYPRRALPNGAGEESSSASSYHDLIESIRTVRRQACDAGTEKAPPFGVLGMDACFMSMAEVCYQIRDHADYLVGAEGYEPEAGWPYRRILRAALKKRAELGQALKPAELARLMVEQYLSYYSDYDRTVGLSVDLSAVRVGNMGTLKEPLTALASALLAALDDPLLREQIVLAHWEAQTYKFHQFVDLRDLCERLKSRFSAANLAGSSSLAQPVQDACSTIIDHWGDWVHYCGCAGPAYQYSYGLSIYMPWATVAKSYKNLALAQDTGWHLFLEAYEKTTERPARPLPQFVEVPPAQPQSPASESLRLALTDVYRPRFEKHFFQTLIETPGIEHGLSGHRYARKTKYAGKTKYARKTKYADDQERSVKNFPLVTGAVVLDFSTDSNGTEAWPNPAS